MHNNPYEAALVVASTMAKGGYAGAAGRALPMVVETVRPYGQHLEIGSLYGATALAALFGGAPRVVCVDPFESSLQESCLEPERATRVEGVFWENIGKYRDRVELVKAKSQPWPIDGREFQTALIDGFHYGETPLQDAMKCSECVKEYIMLDDVDEGYVDVFDAFLWLCQSPGWFLDGMLWRTARFRRRVKARPNMWRPLGVGGK